MYFFIIIFNSTIWGASRNLAPFVKFIKHDKHPWRSIILVKFHAKAWQNICCDIHRLKTASRFYCALSYLLLLWHSSSKNSKHILLCIVIFTISQNAPTCQSSTGFLNSSNMQPSKNWEEVSVFIHFIVPFLWNLTLWTLNWTHIRRSEDVQKTP